MNSITKNITKTKTISKTLILCATLASSPLVFAASNPVISEVEYELNDIENLSLDFDHTKISITANESDLILLRMEQKLKKGKAEYCLQKFTKDHSSSTLKLSAEIKESSVWGSNCSVERKLVIQLGKGSVNNLLIKHSHGSMTLDNASYSELTLNASHTEVDITNLQAKQAELELHHGRLAIKTINADQLTLNGSHSTLDIDKAVGNKMEAQWRHGKADIEESQFDQVEFDSAHSKIDFVKHKGQMMDVEAAHSNIRVNTTDSERIVLSNKHGPIYYEGDAKFIKAKNAHGQINLTQTSLARFEIEGRNSHGNIVVKVPTESTYQYSLDSDDQSFFTKSTQAETESKSQINLKVSHGRGTVKEI